MNQEAYVKASELGEYIYCKRGWWLRQRGLLPETEAMREGTMQHNKLSHLLTAHKRYFIFALLLILLGIAILAYSIYSLYEFF